jgi:hypothetical protein
MKTIFTILFLAIFHLFYSQININLQKDYGTNISDYPTKVIINADGSKFIIGTIV